MGAAAAATLRANADAVPELHAAIRKRRTTAAVIQLFNAGHYTGNLTFHPDGATLPPNILHPDGLYEIHFHLSRFRDVLQILSVREALQVHINRAGVGSLMATGFLPPLFAVCLMVFYRRQRRYVVEHLVFSTHYQTFAFIAIVLAWPLYLLTGLAMSRGSAVLAVAMTALMTGYLVVALRNVYGQSWLVSSIKGLFLYACYYLIYFVMMYGMLALAIVTVTRGG